MMDSDLAELYSVETKVLNQAVRRNFSRFPQDFMFECNSSDLESLRSQFVTANSTTHWNYKRRTMPMLFTEGGIAMLSTVLNSERAIQVNIAIIRIFIKLRSSIKSNDKELDRISHLEESTNKLFKIVFSRLDEIDELVTPKLSPGRNKIGLNPEKI